jgi:site-specific DNA recombinase
MRLRHYGMDRTRNNRGVAHENGSMIVALSHSDCRATAKMAALINQEPFNRAQQQLAYNRQMGRRNNRIHSYLLRSLVSRGRCPLACPVACMCRPATSISSAEPWQADGERCPARYIPTRALENLVWGDLYEVLSAPEMIVAARQANLRRGRAALRQQLERLTEAYLAGVIALAEYERRRRDADNRVQATGPAKA